MYTRNQLYKYEKLSKAEYQTCFTLANQSMHVESDTLLRVFIVVISLCIGGDATIPVLMRAYGIIPMAMVDTAVQQSVRARFNSSPMLTRVWD